VKLTTALRAFVLADIWLLPTSKISSVSGFDKLEFFGKLVKLLCGFSREKL
jgi:hypothetical protein